MNMHAPQIILIVLMSLSLWRGIDRHGTTTAEQNNAWINLVSVALLVAVLWWGGFWSQP